MRRIAFELGMIVFSGLMAAAISGCTATIRASSSPPRPARINHVVLFKLKNPADARELIADCDRTLSVIPGVVAYFAGQHFDTGRGDRVEHDYDVAAYFGFKSEVDYASFIQHSSHIAAANKWRPRTEWMRIDDILDDTP